MLGTKECFQDKAWVAKKQIDSISALRIYPSLVGDQTHSFSQKGLEALPDQDLKASFDL
jgi:hypothetical protein